MTSPQISILSPYLSWQRSERSTLIPCRGTSQTAAFLMVFYKCIILQVIPWQKLIRFLPVDKYVTYSIHCTMMQNVAVCWSEHVYIQDWNKEWADRIKLEKFRWHNSQWLDMVENSMDDKDFGIPSDDLPPFLNGDLMHLYPTGNLHSLCI